MDEDLLKNLVEDNINTWWMATEIHKGDLGWGSPNFHKMGRAKVKLIQDFVRWVSLGAGQGCWVASQDGCWGATAWGLGERCRPGVNEMHRAW